MRIVLLAVDDEFAGEMQRPLYEMHPEWVVGSVISSRMIYKRSNAGAVLFVARKSGLTYLAEMARIKTVRRFSNDSGGCFPSELAARQGVEQFVTPDINNAASIAKLRSWEPDLIISTNFSHYMGKTVRESIAKYGCWNLHKSLLPQYRGMAPVFHALLEGATTVGATLHLVARGFDTGDILAQIEVPVRSDDTVYGLNRDVSKAGGKLMASFLETYVPSQCHPTSQPEGPWKTYTYPTRNDIRAFRRKKLRFYESESNAVERNRAVSHSGRQVL